MNHAATRPAEGAAAGASDRSRRVRHRRRRAGHGPRRPGRGDEPARGGAERTTAGPSSSFFSGLSVEDAAEVLGVGSATVKRDWAFARAWLRKELDAAAAGEAEDGAAG
ncbi:MAG: ECF-type sigma factor [Phycisphaerales bacterium]